MSQGCVELWCLCLYCLFISGEEGVPVMTLDRALCSVWKEEW